MDAKGKKVFAALTKLGEDSDAFDVSMAAKMDEEAVEKILQSLVEEGAATSKTNDKGTALYTAVKGGGAAAKPAKPKKEKVVDVDLSSDDDDDFGAKKSGGGSIVPTAIVGVLAIVAIALAFVLSGSKAGSADLESLQTKVETIENDAREKITALEAENTALKARVDSLAGVVSNLSRPAPTGGSRPGAARSQQRRR